MKAFKYLLGLILIAVIVAAGCQLLPGEQTVPAPTPTPASPLQVTFLDVGQADSIAIQANGTNMLIDAGTNATAGSLVNSLKNLGIKRFDVLIATHPHEDHIGGMDAVVKNFDIGTIYMPAATTTTQTYIDLINAIKNKGLTITNRPVGSVFEVGPLTCTLLAPNSQNYEDLNNYSIVMHMVFGQHSFLFTGDAQADSEKEILAKSYTLKSDVLKVGHHGSVTSTSSDFLKAISPSYAVIMAGQGNDYGHPHQQTLDKLNAAGVRILRTDQNGSITFTSDGTDLAVRTVK
jgi:competence protein ComEC